MICLLFSIPSLEQKWTQGGSVPEGAAGSTEPWDRQALCCFGTGTDLLYILTLPRDCLGEGAGPVRLRMGRLPRLKITLCCSWACFVSRRGSGGEAGLLLQGPG